MPIVRWSIWLALLGYFCGLAAILSNSRAPGVRKLARLFWTLGCGSFLIHVGSAFHFHYQWSHEAALLGTARDTAARTGINSGSGLYLNYLFTGLWALDVAAWWGLGMTRYEQRPAWIDRSLHAFFFFMAFNSTVVFEDGIIRWLGLAASLVLLGTLVYSHRVHPPVLPKNRANAGPLR